MSHFGLSGWSCRELVDFGAEQGFERFGEFAVDVFVVFDEKLFEERLVEGAANEWGRGAVSHLAVVGEFERLLEVGLDERLVVFGGGDLGFDGGEVFELDPFLTP